MTEGCFVLVSSQHTVPVVFCSRVGEEAGISSVCMEGESGSAWFGAKTDVTCVGAALMHGQVVLLLRR